MSKINENIFFSICIPLYNTEKYIEECLNSVLNQTYKNFEIIVIDDGSTDSGAEIVKKYILKDFKIKLIQQKNMGLFHTRIRAIEEAKGEYIISLDADDFLEEKALEILEKTIRETKSQIIIYNNYIAPNNKDKYKNDLLYSSQKEWISNKEELLKEFIFTTKVNSIWRKVILKELFNTEKLKNMPRISMAEDWIHSYYPLVNAEKIIYIPEYIINYRIFDSSMTKKYDYDLWKTLEIIYNLNMELLNNNVVKTISYEDIELNYLQLFSKMLMYIPGKVNDKIKYFEMLKEIRKNKKVREIYKRNKLSLLYKIPFLLLYFKFDNLLYIFKNIVSKIRK